MSETTATFHCFRCRWRFLCGGAFDAKALNCKHQRPEAG